MGYLAKTDHLDARVLSHFASTLHGSERCEQLLLRLPSVEQQELAALIDRRLDKHFKDKLDLLKGFKGVGPTTQAVLMSMLPELGHAGRHGIGKRVGVSPLARDSGTLRGKRTCWGGHADVRTVLYMAALSAV